MKKEKKVEWEELENMSTSCSETSEQLKNQEEGIFFGDENLEGKESFLSKSNKIELSLSGSLYRKLFDKAKQEGVSFSELASELLAEGLVLRAWEIMERKSAMKGPSSQQQGGQRNQRSNYNRNHNYSSKGKYRSGGNNFQTKPQKKYNKFSNQDMGDNANFIEYVRNQEKKNSW